MSTRRIEDAISDWLVDEAPGPFPDRLFREALDEARSSHRRRSRWPALAIPRVGRIAALAGALIVVAAIAVAAWAGDPSRHSIGGQDATATPSPTIDEIAFQRMSDRSWDVFVATLDPSGGPPLVERQLTTDGAADGEPNWSPDGARIAFTRGPKTSGDVYVMNADGSNLTRLTTSPAGDRQPAFSPDGKQIAFLRFEDPDYFDIYVMDADGSNQRLVFHEDGLYVGTPRWSPDGQSLFFNLDASAGGELDIVRLDLATGDRVPIRTTPGDDSVFALSPDGTTIAFQSDRSPGGLFLMDIDGSSVRHLVGSSTKGEPMSWAPDGERLVFADESPYLWLVRADGTGLTRWVEGEQPAWRPNN
jgi:Tol biopolymer transport system component